MAEIIVKDILPLTEEQLEQIDNLKNVPIVYDDDSPESTPAMLKSFELAAKTRDRLIAN